MVAKVCQPETNSGGRNRRPYAEESDKFIVGTRSTPIRIFERGEAVWTFLEKQDGGAHSLKAFLSGSLQTEMAVFRVAIRFERTGMCCTREYLTKERTHARYLSKTPSFPRSAVDCAKSNKGAAARNMS